MKKIFTIIPVLLLLIATSCEKVVDPEIKRADQRYVIEGVLTNEAGQCQVKVSKTLHLNESNVFKGVSGAQVSITDENGLTAILAEATPGIYRSDFQGKPGSTYTLKVAVNGNRYTAQSVMPVQVAFDSLYVTEMEMVGAKEIMPNAAFRDPAGKGHYYRFVQYRNGKKDKHVFVLDDQLSDGRPNTATLFQDADEEADKIKKGDRINVEMQCIDHAVYKYWFSLVQGATGEDGAASPANPVTNIHGGALGYFSAHTVSSKSILVR